MIRRKLLLLTLALFLTAPTGQLLAQARSEPKTPSKPTLEQQRLAARLVSRFRSARKDPQRRAEVVESAVQGGHVCVSALYMAIAREMQPQINHYSTRFYQQAKGAAKKKIGSVRLEEVAKLRQTVLGLQNQPDFTKETIVKLGDPALKQLEEIFVVDRAQVLEESESLKTERQQLQEPGKLWERCAVYLYEQLPNDENKPKDPPSFEQYLQGEEALAAGLAAPMDRQTAQIIAANARLAQQLEPEEGRAVLALNLTRNLLGLSALAIDLKLCAAARDHSNDMQTLKFFAHESPVPGKTAPWDRAKRFGTSASGENICLGVRDGKAVNMAWFHSPGHHKNMLGKHSRVGMGQVGAYFTELFGN